MIRTPCGFSGAFSLIYWLFINQFRHDTYQIKDEYHSYSFLNVDISTNIAFTLFKFGTLILDIPIERTVSQICFYLCLFYAI